MIYYLIFLISILITYFAQKCFEDSKKTTGTILSFFAILIPSLVAGLRHVTIGTDVEFYAYPAFQDSLSLTYQTFITKYASALEIGYSTFVFGIARITNNFQILLFLSQFITMYFVYKFLYEKRKEIPMCFSLLIYFLFCYNSSLNIMRQSIAMAIILYSIATFENKKYIKTILLFLLAISFHKATIFALPMYILIHINNKWKSSKLIIKIICVSLVAITFFAESVILFLGNKGLVPGRYYYYFSGFALAETNYKIFETLFKLIWIVMYIYYLKLANREKKEKLDIYFIFLLIDMILFPISYKVTNAYRLGMYYCIPGMLMIIPKTIKIFKNNRESRITGYALIIAILTFYWYWLYINHGYAETYPYKLFFN